MQSANPVVTLELFAETVSMRMVDLRLGHVGNSPAVLQQTCRNHRILSKVRFPWKPAGLLQSGPSIGSEGIRKKDRFETKSVTLRKRPYPRLWGVIKVAGM